MEIGIIDERLECTLAVAEYLTWRVVYDTFLGRFI